MENKNQPRKNLQDIINAVAEKENVITAFKGEKKSSSPAKSFGLSYLIWNFCGGLCFGLGLLIMVILTALILTNFNEVQSITGLFGKFTVLLKSLGR